MGQRTGPAPKTHRDRYRHIFKIARFAAEEKPGRICAITPQRADEFLFGGGRAEKMGPLRLIDQIEGRPRTVWDQFPFERQCHPVPYFRAGAAVTSSIRSAWVSTANVKPKGAGIPVKKA